MTRRRRVRDRKRWNKARRRLPVTATEMLRRRLQFARGLNEMTAELLGEAIRAMADAIDAEVLRMVANESAAGGVNEATRIPEPHAGH